MATASKKSSSGRNSKRKRSITRRDGGHAETVYWEQVRAEEIGVFVLLANTIGVAASLGNRRDDTALSVRFYHPEFDIEAWWGVLEEQHHLPDSLWDYLLDLVEVIAPEKLERITDAVENTRKVS